MEVISATARTNWLHSHSDLKRERPVDGGPAPGRDFVNFLWPAGIGYASPLCPAFLAEYGGSVVAGSRPVCLARDGLVPLLWFFREFPEPRTASSWLLVHSELAPFIPTPWRKASGQYRLENDPKMFRGRKTNRLVLTGVMMDAYCDLAELEERLELVCENLGSSKEGLEEVLAFIPARTDGFGVEHRHEYVIDYVTLLSRFFGSKVKGITWNAFDSRESWDGFAVCDLNSRFACADSYLLHRAASKGARIVGEETASPLPQASSRKEGQRWVQLSPFHGVRAEPVTGKCVFDDGNGLPEEMKKGFEQRYMAAMRSEANRRFPWPQWFAAWTRVLAEDARKKRPRSMRDNQ